MDIGTGIEIYNCNRYYYLNGKDILSLKTIIPKNVYIENGKVSEINPLYIKSHGFAYFINDTNLDNLINFCDVIIPELNNKSKKKD